MTRIYVSVYLVLFYLANISIDVIRSVKDWISKNGKQDVVSYFELIGRQVNEMTEKKTVKM
jgi:hypothetical protein